MGILIEYKNNIVLDCSNSLFHTLFLNIKEVISNENIKIKKNINNMLEKMDQEVYGFGAIYCDIANYLTNKADIIFFAKLVNQAIVKIIKTIKLEPQAEQRLWNFHKELLKYAEELKE